MRLQLNRGLKECCLLLFFVLASIVQAQQDGAGGASGFVTKLKSENREARLEAVRELLRLAPRSPDAVKALAESLSDSDRSIRITAAEALGAIGPDAGTATQALIAKLTSPDPLDIQYQDTIVPNSTEQQGSVRRSAIYALGRIGVNAGKSVSLIVAILNEDPRLRRTAAEALGNIGPDASETQDAIEPLIRILGSNDPDTTRGYAAQSLGIIASKAPSPEPAQRALMSAVTSSTNNDIRYKAVIALARIGRPTKPVLDVLCAELSDQDSYLANASGEALKRLRPADPNSINALKNALHDDATRRKAAEALGAIGAPAKVAIGDLVKSFEAEERTQGLDPMRTIADSLGIIASSLEGSQDIDAIDTLTEARRVIGNSPYGEINSVATQIGAAVDRLKKTRDGRLREKIFGWLGAHSYVSGIISAYFVLLVLWLGLLWLNPVFLLKINDALKPYMDYKLPSWLGGITVPLRYVLLLGFFEYNPRVLDGWVNRHIDQARARFRANLIVKEREEFVPIPVAIKEPDRVTILGPGHLQKSFSAKLGYLLIYGEGGAGKTSLACQIAEWAMSQDEERRICKDHVMLPVLIRQDLVLQATDGQYHLLDAIHGQLKSLIEQPFPISTELLEQLLRQQRVLVIADGLSEMNDSLRKLIQPADPNFPANALIVTSRIEEKLGNVPKTVIKPLRIKGTRLSSFMEAYLTERSKRDLFDDPEYFEGCRRLSVMVGDRDITVLLAKLFAEQMIASKEHCLDDDLPQNIPDLMLSYLNELNRTMARGGPDNATIHNAAKIVAWECLKRNYQPRQAKLADVVESFNKNSLDKELIETLADRHRIIQLVGPGQDYIRFSLDPLAEYLAALHLLDTNGENQEPWTELLEGIDRRPEVRGKIAGFLLALRDCCLAKMTNPDVITLVSTQLASLAELPLEPESRAAA